MSTASAKVRKFPCESCGADVRWEPGVSAMRCPYCGLLKELAPTGGVAEQWVDAALRKPRDLGWGATRKVMHCKRCGAHQTLDPHVAASHCAFCATAAVVEAPPDPNVVRPEGLLPFRVTRDQATQQFRHWQGKLWFRPNDLKSASRVTSLHGVYLPFWTFDAATYSHWTAEAGHYYYVTVNNQRQRRVRWVPASGSLDLFFDDVPVPASRGVEPELCQQVEPFPTHELIEYEPSYLSGFLAEENAIDLHEALETAKMRMRGIIRSQCASQVPGDTHRNLQVHTTFSALAYKNALLPIWIAAYDYKGTPYRFIVNGVTGACSGKAPLSWVKIFFALLAALILVLLFGYAKQANGQPRTPEGGQRNRNVFAMRSIAPSQSTSSSGVPPSHSSAITRLPARRTMCEVSPLYTWDSSPRSSFSSLMKPRKNVYAAIPESFPTLTHIDGHRTNERHHRQAHDSLVYADGGRAAGPVSAAGCCGSHGPSGRCFPRCS